MSEPTASFGQVSPQALTLEDQQKLRTILGRELSQGELDMLSGMADPANCGTSIGPLLVAAPTKSAKILVNATQKTPGLLDIGDNFALVLEPSTFETALNPDRTTGVGRDLSRLIWQVLNLGAKPKCLMTSLGLGPSSNKPGGTAAGDELQAPSSHERSVCSFVLKDISQVGTCFGIPTMLSQVYLSKSCQARPRANVFCLGLLTHTQIPGTVAADNPGSSSDTSTAEELALEETVLQEIAGVGSQSDISSIKFTLPAIPELAELRNALPVLIAWPPLALKYNRCSQGEQKSRSDIKQSLGSDASIFLFNENRVEKILSVAVTGNPAYIELDPFQGATHAMAEATRQLGCCGSQPLGASVCLALDGSSSSDCTQKLPKILRAIGAACRVFNTPLSGSSVQVRNEPSDDSSGLNLAVALVGTIPRAELITSKSFKEEGDAIILLGDAVDLSDPLQGLGGSAYLEQVHALKAGNPSPCNLEREQELQLAVRALIYSGEIQSAHSCGLGGLAVALAESCISFPAPPDAPRLLGARIELSHLFAAPDDAAGKEASSSPIARLDAVLFGEAPGRVIISTHPMNAVKVIARARLLGVHAVQLGTVGGTTLEIKTGTGEMVWPLTELQAQMESS